MFVSGLSGIRFFGDIVKIDLLPRCQECTAPLTYQVITRDRGNSNRYRNYECKYYGEWHYFYHDNEVDDQEETKFRERS